MHLRIHRQFYQYIKGRKPGNPLEAVPGLVLLLLCTLVGCIIYELINKGFTEESSGDRLYLIYCDPDHDPGVSPIADYAIEQIGKIGLLPLCTPILAYAGISIGKDVDTFKKQGFAIVVVAIFTFAGTFLGSTIIAQIILK